MTQKCFLRGHPHLCKYMPKQNVQNRRKKPDPENEPDFYEICKDYPLRAPPVNFKSVLSIQASSFPLKSLTTSDPGVSSGLINLTTSSQQQTRSQDFFLPPRPHETLGISGGCSQITKFIQPFSAVNTSANPRQEVSPVQRFLIQQQQQVNLRVPSSSQNVHGVQRLNLNMMTQPVPLNTAQPPKAGANSFDMLNRP